MVAEKGANIPACSAPVIEIENLYRALGPIAAAYYGNPTAQMIGIAVTGTNGKTTTANWIADLMNRFGTRCACIGTLGCTLSDKVLPSVSMTTPDPLTLQATFAELLSLGCKAFAMEASSIGLEQGRLDGTEIKTGRIYEPHAGSSGLPRNHGKATSVLRRSSSAGRRSVPQSLISRESRPKQIMQAAEGAGKGHPDGLRTK